VGPIAATPILSPLGKLRLAAEVFVPQRIENADESLASFVRRRFGRETYERLVQPLVAGIYTADPERLSVAAAMPRFVEMERRDGSLIRAMWRQRRKNRNSDARIGSGARYSQFVAPRHGMSSLVDAAASSLESADILLDSPVVKIERPDSAKWTLRLGGPAPRNLSVDGVIVAMPANRGSRLLRDVDIELAEELAKIEYGSCAVINFGFRREQIKHRLDGFGFVVPRIEGLKILSASFSSVKYIGRAPENMALVRVFVGGACQRELLDLPDEQLLDLALSELRDLLDIREHPVMRHLVRRHQAMPQYHVGHQSLVARIRARESAISGFALAGNALEGIGVPNCIDVGQRAAERLVFQLNKVGNSSTQTA
jgi:oxygen-dependent protoporphyrinogen oxidase